MWEQHGVELSRLLMAVMTSEKPEPYCMDRIGRENRNSNSGGAVGSEKVSQSVQVRVPK